MAPDNTTLSAQVNKMNSASEQKDSDTAASELVTVVDDLLVQLSTKFNSLSGELIGKMDEMSRRLDTLEANLQAANSTNTADTSS